MWLWGRDSCGFRVGILVDLGKGFMLVWSKDLCGLGVGICVGLG